MYTTIRRALITIVALGMLAAGGLAAWGWYRYQVADLAFGAYPVRIEVAKGAGPLAIANELNRKGASVPPLLVRLAFRLRGGIVGMKSGIYQIDRPESLRAVLDRLYSGRVTLEDIRLVEGWTVRQIRAQIDRHPDLAHDTRGLSEQALLERIGAKEPALEGLLFPSTYYFSPGSSDVELYKQAYRRMQQTLEEAWSQRAPDLPIKTPYEALVLASIVEKETGLEADRDKVAAVFVNRLRKRMMLQSDPTTIYGLGERFDGNLRRSHLQADTPYNTYTRTGLPPTPISAPGRASLVATLRPASIGALYFVARGDGTSEFSDDLPAHNRAVSRYQLKRQ
ncbi:MAG: endolytic transglycosylase MltG [Burkholderiaceae bacterium]